MCRAVRFEFEGRRFEYRFTQYQARLPLLLKSGHCSLVSWGRRRNESGTAPFGASVRLASIQAGRWDAFLPKPVKIAVHEFMETDVMGQSFWRNGLFLINRSCCPLAFRGSSAVHEFMETDVMGHEHWFQVMPGQYLQGMLTQQGNRLRVYTVQLDCNAEDTFFQNWPRIVNSPF